MTGRAIRILVGVISFLGVLILSQPAALADQVTMQLINPPPGSVMYNVYISPYLATIKGISTSVICDDFVDDTYTKEIWTAYVFDGSADLSNTRMADARLLEVTALNDDYDAVAWLALRLYSPGISLAQQGLYSFAIWDIFADASVHAWLGARGGASFYSDVTSEAQIARDNAAEGERSILTIYSPVADSASCGGGDCPTTPPQEFVVVKAPEASAPVILAFDLLALLGVVFLVRRRAVWNAGVAR